MLDTLLVEDNAIFRQMTRDMLLSHYSSICVREAADADEAMDEIGRKCPRIVLMDIKLPGKNGLELTKMLKNLCPNIVVIILTSYDYPEYRDAALECGADYFLVKGTTKAAEVLASINSIVSEDGW